MGLWLQETIELTEENQGGTTPPAEATAEAPAPEQTDTAAVAVDDPAEPAVMADSAPPKIGRAHV